MLQDEPLRLYLQKRSASIRLESVRSKIWATNQTSTTLVQVKHLWPRNRPVRGSGPQGAECGGSPRQFVWNTTTRGGGETSWKATLVITCVPLIFQAIFSSSSPAAIFLKSIMWDAATIFFSYCSVNLSQKSELTCFFFGFYNEQFGWLESLS